MKTIFMGIDWLMIQIKDWVMAIIALLILFTLAGAGPLWAASIESDPVPANAVQPETFQIFLDGSTVPQEGPVIKSTAGLAFLHWDIPVLPDGMHTVIAKFCAKAAGCSGPSVPFSFPSGLPPVPAGLRVQP